MSEQREGLRHLLGVYAWLLNASGQLSDEDADVVDLGVAVVSDDCLFSLQLSDVKEVLEDLGMFVLDNIEETGADAMTELVKDIAVCTVNLIASVDSVVAERDSSNEAALEMPPVLPHKLVLLQGQEFANIVRV